MGAPLMGGRWDSRERISGEPGAVQFLGGSLCRRDSPLIGRIGLGCPCLTMKA